MLGDSVWDVEAAKRAGHPHRRRHDRRLLRGRAARRGRRRGLRVDRRAARSARRPSSRPRRRLPMSANTTRRTKIVATVGPASREPAVLRELIDAGVDVFRLNFSHGTAAEHAENVERIRAVAAEAGVEMGILGDLPGPKLRLGRPARRRRGAALGLEGRPARRRQRDRRRRAPAGPVGRDLEGGRGRPPRLPGRRPRAAEGRRRQRRRGDAPRSRPAARSAPTRA